MCYTMQNINVKRVDETRKYMKLQNCPGRVLPGAIL